MSPGIKENKQKGAEAHEQGTAGAVYLTAKEYKMRPATFRELVERAKDIVFVAVIAAPIFGTVGTLTAAGAWAIYGPSIISAARIELGIDEIRQMAVRALGEDRVIRQPPGLSYISEPVYPEKNAEIVLVLERTARGLQCLFKGGQIIFQGSDGIPRPSKEPLAVRQQIGDDLTRFQLSHPIPSGLPYGRASAYLSLDYNCNGNLTSDRTYEMPFTLSRPPKE